MTMSIGANAPSIWSVARSMKGCLVSVFMYWLLTWGLVDLTLGFYRTLVSCETPRPINGTCPTGSFFRGGECAPIPPGDINWSGSARCFDKLYVIQASTELSGRVGCITLGLQAVFCTFFSTLLVDRLGRKPLMLSSFLVNWCYLALFCVSCFDFISARLQLIMVYTGYVIQALGDTFPPAALAMCADLSKDDEVERGVRVSAASGVQAFAVVCGYTAGFFILRADVANYKFVYLLILCVCTVMSTIVCSSLRETLVEASPAEDCLVHGNDHGSAEGCGRAIVAEGRLRPQSCSAEFTSAWKLVWRDPVLRYIFVISFLANAAILGGAAMNTGWAMAVCGHSQAVASLTGIVQPGSMVLGSIASSYLLPKAGATGASCIAILIFGLTYVYIGLGAFYREAARIFFWSGMLLIGFGMGISAPAFFSMISPRVSTKDQGKLMSISVFGVLIGTATGVYGFTNYAFDSTSPNPWSLAGGWFIASGIMGVVLVLNCMVFFLYLAPETRSRRGQITPADPSCPSGISLPA